MYIGRFTRIINPGCWLLYTHSLRIKLAEEREGGGFIHPRFIGMCEDNEPRLPAPLLFSVGHLLKAKGYSSKYTTLTAVEILLIRYLL